MSLLVENNDISCYATSLRYQPGISAWRNTELKYLSVTDELATLLGFKHREDMEGLTDSDLRCGAADMAEAFNAQNRELIARKSDREYLCFSNYTNGWNLLYGKNTLALNSNNEIIALHTYTSDITSTPTLNMGTAFNRILRNKISEQKGFYIFIEKCYREFSLTRRQSQCLFYSLHGYSSKEVGRILNLSSRTVEAHIEKIKSVTHCNSKIQLFDKAASYGLLDLFIA